MAEKRFYKDLKKLAKRANQRMVELERRGMETNAYESVQGYLEMAGVKRKSATGRRFSETGKATYNEYEVMKKFLDRFLNSKTSTVSGTKKFYNDVWEGAKRNLEIDKYGITKDEYLAIWENLPAKKKDRLYGSSTIIKMTSTALRKNDTLEDENKMSVKEIVEEIQNSKNVKSAYKSLGITYKDMKQTTSLGRL